MAFWCLLLSHYRQDWAQIVRAQCMHTVLPLPALQQSCLAAEQLMALVKRYRIWGLWGTALSTRLY